MLSSIHQCNGASWLRVIVGSKNAQEALRASDGSNTYLTQCASLLHAISALTRLGFGGLFEPISLAEFEPKGEKDVLRLLD